MGNITNRHGLCTAQDRRALQRVIKTAQNITDTHLPRISGKRQNPPQPQPVYPAALWQVTQYPLLYHQTREQLLSSGCETPQFIIRTPP